MNIVYIIGIVAAFVVMIIGMMLDGLKFVPLRILNFGDPASVVIVVGCTFAVLAASFPTEAL